MIKTIADLLRELLQIRAKRLDQEPVKHAPTIGEMYEGLARDILERVIPTGLDVRVVDGFIEGADGTLSPQIDAMVVTGEGRTIPFTSSFVWPISQVVAAFEIKKTLYSKDLADAFEKLKTVKCISDSWIRDGVKVNAEPSFQAFARTTGYYPESLEDIQHLPQYLKSIFHQILIEQISPLRVILGYQGFVDERSLRNGLYKFLESRGIVTQYGASSLPNLIITRSNAILKMDGHPYASPLHDGWWHILTSNSENPIRILLELLWTKLTYRVGGTYPEDENLSLERLAPFIDARFGRSGDLYGWTYSHIALSKKELASTEPPYWTPDTVNEDETSILFAIAASGQLDVRDESFRSIFIEKGVDPDILIANMVTRRLIGWVDQYCVRMIDEGSAITMFSPDGQIYSATDTTRFGVWLEQEIRK